MMNILNTGLPVLADNINHIQRFLAVRLLAPAHHHPGQHITCALVQRPFHQNKRGLGSRKVALKRTVLCIPVPLMDKGRCDHLHEDRFSTAVPQGNQCALPIKMKTFVADPDRIVVIIHIDQPHGIDLTHPPSPPVCASPVYSCSGSAGSSP